MVRRKKAASKKTTRTKPRAPRHQVVSAGARATPVARGDGRLRFTEPERDQLNHASTLLQLAQENLARVWRPIRAKYRLPEEIVYDRQTGEVQDHG